jgi:hypothetical protein
LVSTSNTDSDRTWTKSVKKNLKKAKKSLSNDNNLSVEFSASELDLALSSIKNNKSPGFDGIFPEFLINMGPGAKGYILKVFNKILSSGNVPTSFKKSKIIAFNKPGKDGSEANHYRPISLLSNCYSLLERLIYNRIAPPP